MKDSFKQNLANEIDKTSAQNEKIIFERINLLFPELNIMSFYHEYYDSINLLIIKATKSSLSPSKLSIFSLPDLITYYFKIETHSFLQEIKNDTSFRKLLEKKSDLMKSEFVQSSKISTEIHLLPFNDKDQYSFIN